MWEINVTDQLKSFVLAILLGFAVCLVYDLIRAFRAVGLNSKTSVFITDVFFSFISAFITFVFLLVFTNGELRAYALAAELFGFILSRFTLSKIAFAFFKVLLGVIVRCFAVSGTLYNRFLNLSNAFFGVLLRKIKKILKIAVKTAKKLLKSVCEMLYTKPNSGQTGETE